jgi:hypothetical protein
MTHHQATVPGGMDVELDGGGSGIEGGPDGEKGGRRGLPGAALVGVGDDPPFQPRGDPAWLGVSGHRKNGSLCPAMLDHVFTQLVSSHRRAFEGALLQRQAVEERFQVDVFLGDVSFETSYSLPGEQRPARIRVDTSLDWPTWSQTAYRSRSIGEEPDEVPEVLVEIAFRVQGLQGVPDAGPLLAVLPLTLEFLGEPLARSSATVEQVLMDEPEGPECAIEVSYEGSCQLDEATLDDPARLDESLAPLGRAVASVLVRIGDLPFTFRTVESPPA